MRANVAKNELMYNNTRLLLFEMQVGNANYNAKDKPKHLKDVFSLSSDEVVIITKTSISSEEKAGLESLGYKLLKTQTNEHN